MKVVEFGQKFICFSLVVEGGKRVVNISKVCWRLLCLRKQLFSFGSSSSELFVVSFMQEDVL